MTDSLTIVTRTSALALWQAEFVRMQLQKHYPQLEVQLLGIKTMGDRWLQTSLQEIGGKALFVKELEEALLAGKADLAVHSLKDIPADFPEGLGLAAVCARDNPLDAWISPKGLLLEQLPRGARVGTSSLRRVAQLRQLRNDLDYVPLRGNIDSRLRQCLAGEWDAIVLAYAGLERLKLTSHITQVFSLEQVLPAVGQGALAIESRLEDHRTNTLLSVLNDATTRACIEAERAMNARLGGNCHVPVAGFAQCHEQTLHLKGWVGHAQRLDYVAFEAKGHIKAPVLLGEEVAEHLIAQGAKELIGEGK